MMKFFWMMALVHFQFLSDLPVTTLSFNAGELKQAFNQSADRTRMVVVFSPT